MKKLFLTLLFFLFFLLNSKIAFAHPGNTASDGCHYCRTNCAKWGEIEGARHCHNSKPTSVPTYKPTVKPQPTSTLPKPSPVATNRPTSKPIPSVQPNSKPKPTIKAENQINSNNDSSDDDSLWTILAIGGLGFGGYQWFKNKK